MAIGHFDCPPDINDPTGKLMDFLFSANGNTADKWLGIGNGSTSSDTLPLIVPQDGNIIWASFSNQDDDVDIDMEIYLNNSLVDTWQIRNKRTAWKTDFTPMACMQGDRISVYLKRYSLGSGDDTAQDPAIEIFIQIDGVNSDEGGTKNGV